MERLHVDQDLVEQFLDHLPIKNGNVMGFPVARLWCYSVLVLEGKSYKEYDRLGLRHGFATKTEGKSY